MPKEQKNNINRTGQMIVDTTFNIHSDAQGGDPDNTSPTLRKYHKILWSKTLSNGKKLSYDTLLRYKNFFNLFDSFIGFINFFLLEDLIDEKQKIKFYLPFDDFKTRPSFSDIDEYKVYKNGLMNFIKSRNKRIENFANQLTIE